MTITTIKKAAKGRRFKLVPGLKLTEDQIAVFVNHYKNHQSFPGSKIPCNLTGKLTTAVGPWLRKKVVEFGSAEKLLRNYVCRQATKKQKPATIFKKRRKKDQGDSGHLTKVNGRYDIPLINTLKTSRPLNESELAKDSKTVCLRPDVFLSNGRHCEGCKYYKVCENNLKTLPKHILFDGNKFISTEELKLKNKKKNLNKL